MEELERALGRRVRGNAVELGGLEASVATLCVDVAVPIGERALQLASQSAVDAHQGDHPGAWPYHEDGVVVELYACTSSSSQGDGDAGESKVGEFAFLRTTDRSFPEVLDVQQTLNDTLRRLEGGKVKSGNVTM